MRWQETERRPGAGLSTLRKKGLVAAAILLLMACSSGNQGMICQGKVQTLDGRDVSVVEGKIIDRYASFSVSLPDLKLESGTLHSSDRRQYVPSAVTKEGWLAMRLSDTRFMVVNAPLDKVITFDCPARLI